MRSTNPTKSAQNSVATTGNYFFIFLLFILFTSSVSAQDTIEACKYGQPLIDALQLSYTPNQTMGYNTARDTMYKNIDSDGLELHCIYTNFSVTLNPNQDPSVSAYQNGSGINAEHVYPQSKGAGNEPMRSDMHNLFPSKVSVNSARGSCPFDEIADTDTDFWYFESTTTTAIPSSNIDAYSEKEDDFGCAFEPREEVKGDIARAVFYFYAIYQDEADAADPNFFDIQKDQLLAWHYADPVDADELQRSHQIAFRQGNDNPFVLDSSLVRRAFFMADASYPDGDEGCYGFVSSNRDILAVGINVYYAPSGLLIINNEQSLSGEVYIHNSVGQLIHKEPLIKQLQRQKINLNRLSDGVYIVTINTDQGRYWSSKFIK